MRIVSIYKIENKIDNKVYIGSTVNFVTRYKAHRTLLRGGYHHSSHLQFAWNKYGESNFWFEVIDECADKDRAITEQYWMNSYNCFDRDFGYNMNPTAESCLGRTHSKETKEKIGAKHKGQIRSQEARDRIRQSKLGKKLSEETRAKISLVHRGRKQSEEQIRKCAEGRRGVKFTDNGRLNVSKSRGGRPFIITNGDLSYELNILNDVIKYGLDPSNVRKCLIGQAKSTRGYTCKYKEAPQFSH